MAKEQQNSGGGGAGAGHAEGCERGTSGSLSNGIWALIGRNYHVDIHFVFGSSHDKRFKNKHRLHGHARVATLIKSLSY